MPSLPSSLALTSIATNSQILSADHRNNYAAIQTGVNGLIAFLNASYTAYTPAWTASGTAPVLGNGTLTGRYLQFGKFTHMQLELIAGSTTTFGTGTWSFSFPVTGVNVKYFAAAELIDTSASTAFAATARLETTTTATVLAHVVSGANVATTFVGNTVPFTWASGDFLRFSLSYEAA